MTIPREHGNKLPLEDSALERARRVLENPSASGIELEQEFRVLVENYQKLHQKLYKTLIISDFYQQESKELSVNLEETLHSFKKLKDVALPICVVCHKIHTTNDYWERLEQYFAKHTDIMFSHGICPDCVKTTYGKLGEKVLTRRKQTEQLPSPSPATIFLPEDEALHEIRSLAERAASSENQLTPEIEKLARHYAKLLRRFNKIVTLGDSYQSQLREFNLRLELMAHTDPLTGISNRGYFFDLLRRELDRAKRYGSTLSVVMLDLDRFKEVNDSFGHAAGDAALRTFTSVITSSGMRQSDFMGRVGGDEFIITLPETPLCQAAEVAERIRCHIASTPVTYDNKEFFISASIGISEYTTDDTPEILINRADKAMFAAKTAGGNRIQLES